MGPPAGSFPHTGMVKSSPLKHCNVEIMPCSRSVTPATPRGLETVHGKGSSSGRPPGSDAAARAAAQAWRARKVGRRCSDAPVLPATPPVSTPPVSPPPDDVVPADEELSSTRIRRPVQPSTLSDHQPTTFGSTCAAHRRPQPTSLADQWALFRAVRSSLLVASHLQQEVPWRVGRTLVDSGSQQPPLLSQDFAHSLGVAPGAAAGTAFQADGTPVPLWKAGQVHMSINGRTVKEDFCVAPIAPYDAILGEDWLFKHHAVLDYDTNTLGLRHPVRGFQPLRLDMLPAVDRPGASILDSPVARQARVVCAQSRSADGMTFPSHGDLLSASLGSPLDVDAAASPSRNVGARLARLQRRHLCSLLPRPSVGDRWLRAHAGVFGLNSLSIGRDPTRELPEDAELEAGDIPGVETAPASSFQFVEREVRQHLSHLSADRIDSVLQRLRVFEDDVFETRTMPRLPPHRQLDLDITEVPGSKPIARRPYPVAPHHLPELDRQISVLLEAGIIRRSVSPYAAPVLFAPKKDGKLRLCTDYRLLNQQTVRDKFPTPTAADLIARTRGARWLSKIDLHSGFHQLRIREQDIHKTAFITPSGQYEYVTAPFGLSSTPSAFQRLMSFVLEEHIRGGYCAVYIDDVAIWSTSDDPLDHLEKLERVLASLREHQLLAKGSKCELFRTEMEFLGFLVGRDGVRPVPEKVSAIQAVPVPETVSHLRSFLGMANFFRHHIASFAEIAAPLTDLLKGTRHGRQRLAWSLSCQRAFDLLKDVLTSAPLLRHFDPTLRTAVHLDASQHAVGAVLLQWEEGEAHPRPVCFLSRKLQGAQFHYDARNAEALAAQMALGEWRHYLYGVPFEIYSDHASLATLMTQKSPSQRLLRLCEFLSEFDFREIRYVRGADNVVPDFLSRPWDPSAPDSGLHLLSHPRLPRHNSLQMSAVQGPDEVVLLLQQNDQVLVQRYGAVLSLPHTQLAEAESPMHAVQRLLRECGVKESPLPLLQQAQVGRFSLWRVTIPSEVSVSPSSGVWRSLPDLHSRDVWQRTAFELLQAFDVFGSGVRALTSAASTDLLSSIKATQSTDAFLAKVRAGVDASDDGVWHDFFLNDAGVLCYQRPEDVGARVCVPLDCRKLVLHAAHGGDTLVGHPGIARTAAHVARYYYWPSLYRDVAHFVRSCRACATSKSSTHRPFGVDGFSSVPVRPFSHWAMDLIGPMPKSRAGNEWIVTWVDRTSKMIVAAATKTGASSGKDLADLTFKEICCRFGLPLKLTHDNDVRFQHLWNEIWRRVGTKISRTAAYNPQSDPAERANRQVLEALRAAVETVARFEDWDKALPHLCFGLNNSVSSATGMSPFELAHGFPARTPLNLEADSAATTPAACDGADYALHVQNRLGAAADQVTAAGVRLGTVLASRSTPVKVSVGDLVWVDGGPKVSQVASKLAPRWFGPFPVLEVFPSGGTVRLDFTAAPHLGRHSSVRNVRHLKFFEPRDNAFCDGDEEVAPLVGPDGVQKWEIAGFEGHRRVRGRRELFVRWKGFDSTWSTWQREADLLKDVPSLVASYWRSPSAWSPRPGAPKRVAPALSSPPFPPRRNPSRRARV